MCWGNNRLYSRLRHSLVVISPYIKPIIIFVINPLGYSEGHLRQRGLGKYLEAANISPNTKFYLRQFGVAYRRERFVVWKLQLILIKVEYYVIQLFSYITD